ncbi:MULTISPECIES: hypothetical protein [Paenarthrobacter]|uniref:hypothetical protein n=1 Tax=Paenarthrobacter TaxID=1742992 RepID=UPI000FEC7C29|nr:hypothetical protein [Paenarthrobacter ureafaciens]RWW91436.1 hypothetical protein AUR_18780 [Paenarthrobacter ureafaciens]
MGPEAVPCAILETVVGGQAPVVFRAPFSINPNITLGLENHNDEIENEVFGGDPAVSPAPPQVLPRSHRHSRSTHSLSGILEALAGDFTKEHPQPPGPAGHGSGAVSLACPGPDPLPERRRRSTARHPSWPRHHVHL